MSGYRDFWEDLDRKVAKFTADLERVKSIVNDAKGCGVKVHPVTFMWRCRLRLPGAGSAETFRSMTADGLLEEIAPVLKEISDFRAKVAEEKSRLFVPEATREDVKSKLKTLKASRLRVRNIGKRPDRLLEWSCVVRKGSRMAEPTLLTATSGSALVALVEKFLGAA